MEGVLFSAIHEMPIMALVAIGFYISLRLMRFPDLSVDASYMFGMSAVGWIVANSYSNEILALPFAMFFGALVGAVTGKLHTSKLFGLSKLLSGLLVSFAAYSICFRLIGNQNPLSLFPFREDMLFIPLIGDRDSQALVSMFFVAVVYFFAVFVMNTSFGYGVRAVGHRKDMLQAVGVSPDKLIIGGLAFANMIVALAGWLTASNTANVPLQNLGMVINALAAVLLGEFLMYVLHWFKGDNQGGPASARKRLYVVMAIPVLGAIAFSFIKAFVVYVLSGELRITITTDLQLVLALIILIIVALGRNMVGFKEFDNDDVI